VNASPIFDPLTINGVEFANRLVRSSIGGRYAYYDGAVNPAWARFERRFAETGVAAIVSATLTVDDHRWAPIEYPKISNDRFIAPIAEGVRAVQALGCRYILQIGDPGYHTQAGLFPEEHDGASASPGFDLLYGYRSLRRELSTTEIAGVVERFAKAAVRVREAGCDGLEVTASKGYLIHQFLNPAINRRRDAYGGSSSRRFTLLGEIVAASRASVGRDFLFGVRLSARDFNYLPVNVRWPVTSPFRSWWFGSDLADTIQYGRRLRELGVDYLHISNGFGFINPKENPGAFPLEELRIFFNSVRHLSPKARLRSGLLNMIPLPLLRRVASAGWHASPGANLDDASAFRREVGLPVMANGGFQERSLVERALGSVDLVSMARPLLANPDLVDLFRAGVETPERPCTFCNRCTLRTTVAPLGCYDPARFSSQDEMEAQILRWSSAQD
jgi:2,4-dienoyl-CoA reductase-like NADH-dependent reductase (Old Yellow Enzyme family)